MSLVVAYIAGTVLGAVPIEVREATLVHGSLNAAAVELIRLVLSRRHCLRIDVAVLVRRCLPVALDAEGVPKTAAVDTEFSVATGEVGAVGTIAHLDVI